MRHFIQIKTTIGGTYYFDNIARVWSADRKCATEYPSRVNALRAVMSQAGGVFTPDRCPGHITVEKVHA